MCDEMRDNEAEEMRRFRRILNSNTRTQITLILNVVSAHEPVRNVEKLLRINETGNDKQDATAPVLMSTAKSSDRSGQLSDDRGDRFIEQHP